MHLQKESTQVSLHSSSTLHDANYCSGLPVMIVQWILECKVTFGIERFKFGPFPDEFR